MNGKGYTKGMLVLGLLILNYGVVCFAEDFYCDSCGNCTLTLASSGLGDTVYLSKDLTELGDFLDSSPEGYCIDLQYVAGPRTFDCGGYTISSPTSHAGLAVAASSSDNITVQNCVFSEFDWAAWVEHSDNFVLSNNTFNDNNLAVKVFALVNGTISDNQITNSSQTGLDIAGCQGTVFEGNTITSSGNYGVFMSGIGTNLTQNTISDNNYGIYFSGSVYNNTLAQNTVCGNSQYDVYVSAAHHVTDNYGEYNTCSLTNGWDDNDSSGCRSRCEITTSTSTTTTTITSTPPTTVADVVSKMDYVKDELTSFVENATGEGVNVGLVAFSSGSWGNCTDGICLTQNLTTDLEVLQDKIDLHEPVAGTCISCGIKKATELFEGVSGGKCMVVSSDGVPNSCTPDGSSCTVDTAKADALYYSALAIESNITVYTVNLPDTADYPFMESLASAGGGAVFNVSCAQSLSEILLEVMDDCGENLYLVNDVSGSMVDEFYLDCPVEGDANGDDVVNYSDLLILAASYAKSYGDSGYDSRADFNGDGTVDYNDLLVLAANYGS